MNNSESAIANPKKYTLLVFVISALAIFGFMHRWAYILYPIGDEFSLLSSSVSPTLEWFTKGFSEYFNTYPEYFSPYTNFSRPFVNFLYSLFPRNEEGFKYQLFILSYCSHAAVTAYLFFLALNNSRSIHLAIAIGVCAFLAPAFWGSPVLIFPAFSSEIIASLLCLLGISLLSQSKYFAGYLCLITAALTKEFALAVIAASAAYTFFKKRYGISLLITLFLVTWFLIRLHSFGGVTGGNYIFNGASIFSRLVRFGVLEFVPIGIDPEFKFSRFSILLNMGIWTCFIYSWIHFKKIGQRHDRESASLFEPNLVLICLIFSVYYFVLIQGVPRFTYFIYIMSLVFLSIFVSKFKIRWIVICLYIIGAGVASLKSYVNLQNQYSIYKYQYIASKNLISLLKQQAYSPKTTYIANDFISAYSAEKNVAKFAGIKEPFNVNRANSISLNKCEFKHIISIETKIHNEMSTTGPQVSIEITLPSCASFVFEGADSAKLKQFIEGDNLRRNSQIYYHIPELNLDKLGKKMVIHIKDARVIYFDFKDGKWKVIGS